MSSIVHEIFPCLEIDEAAWTFLLFIYKALPAQIISDKKRAVEVSTALFKTFKKKTVGNGLLTVYDFRNYLLFESGSVGKPCYVSLPPPKSAYAGHFSVSPKKSQKYALQIQPWNELCQEVF